MAVTQARLADMVTRTAQEARILHREVEIGFKEARLSDYINAVLSSGSGRSREAARQVEMFADIVPRQLGAFVAYKDLMR